MNGPDRQGDVGDLNVIEVFSHLVKLSVTRASPRNGVHRFNPSQRRPFQRAEETMCFAPARECVQVPRRHSLFGKRGRMHVDAKRTAVDLRDAQVDELMQALINAQGRCESDKRLDRFLRKTAGSPCA